MCCIREHGVSGVDQRWTEATSYAEAKYACKENWYLASGETQGVIHFELLPPNYHRELLPSSAAETSIQIQHWALFSVTSCKGNGRETVAAQVGVASYPVGRSLNAHLQGQGFENDEMVETCNSQSADFYRSGIEKLPHWFFTLNCLLNRNAFHKILNAQISQNFLANPLILLIVTIVRIKKKFI